MAIRYLPSDVLRRMAPKKRAKRLVTQKLSVNTVALRSLARTGILSKKTLEGVARKVIRQYKQREKRELRLGASKGDAKAAALSGKKLMVQRVQNAAVFEITGNLKRTYRGEFYEWLPSDAADPDPVHQLNYGEVFQLGVGEAPGDRFGCRCGMNILVDEDTLEL